MCGSEFKHLQRCPRFNSPNHVNTWAPQLSLRLISAGLQFGNSQSYNSKKPPETCTIFRSKCYTSVVSSNADLQFLMRIKKKNTEMILARWMCWAQKMPCIYPAMRVWIWSGIKTENRQSKRFLSAPTPNLSEHFSWHFRCVFFPPLRWKIVHSWKSVNSIA